MYNQFCKNLKNYISINSHMKKKEDLRLKIAEEIVPLTDIKAYEFHKKHADIMYKEITSFISSLSKYRAKYPSFNRFIWELWAYGFDIIDEEQKEHTEIKYMDEKAKLVDLLLGTHYFC